LDLHTRTIYACILDSNGNKLVHKNVQANPKELLKIIEPYMNDDLVIGVETMFSWYWVADFCHDHGVKFILGHALYMRAIHGGKAKSDFRQILD
jgi:transposase